jgi:acetate kinase
MKVIVINSGSSSIKYQLFEMTKETVLAKGIAEKIGENNSEIVLKISEKKQKIEKQYNKIENHKEALSEILKLLEEYKLIQDKKEITAIGHRLVHAGENYHSSVVITEDVLEKMTECNDLAPLHNPHNITGVRTTQELFPGTFQAGCFDTAFHQTMPDYAYIYPIDYSYYEKYKVRRYGFHGTSHMYVSKRASEILNKDYNSLKIITCHLGNGASVAAIKNGKSIDTSMGMTPLEGIMMGTRSGDIDPALVFFITEKDGEGLDGFNKMLNKNSGLKGVSGVSNDVRDLKKAIKSGNKRAELALNMFIYRLKKYIGSYAAAMGGVDVVVFTGGIGENNADIRKRAVENLEFMGIEIDDEINNATRGEEKIISKATSKAKVMLVPTDEELVIARETFRLYKENN